MGTILSSIFGAVVNWIGSFLTRWLQRREDRAQGAKDQAAKETASTATVEAKIAQAEATTDRTQEGIADAASKGQF